MTSLVIILRCPPEVEFVPLIHPTREASSFGAKFLNPAFSRYFLFKSKKSAIFKIFFYYCLLISRMDDLGKKGLLHHPPGPHGDFTRRRRLTCLIFTASDIDMYLHL